jgi:hypothetical protein
MQLRQGYQEQERETGQKGIEAGAVVRRDVETR